MDRHAEANEHIFVTLHCESDKKWKKYHLTSVHNDLHSGKTGMVGKPGNIQLGMFSLWQKLHNSYQRDVNFSNALT
jgi:hypothetical protein